MKNIVGKIIVVAKSFKDEKEFGWVSYLDTTKDNWNMPGMYADKSLVNIIDKVGVYEVEIEDITENPLASQRKLLIRNATKISDLKSLVE